MKRIPVQKLGKNVLQLPRLPIPPLMQTFDTYRTYLRAVSNADLVAQHNAKLDTFIALSAPALQQQLTSSDKAAAEAGMYPYSYVEAMLDEAHLARRDPLQVNSNPAFVLKERVVGAGYTQAGVAAAFAHAIACWIKNALTDGVAITASASTGSAACDDVSPLLHEFGRSRVPGKDMDQIVTTPLDQLRHVIVLHDGHAYMVKVFDDNHNIIDRALIQKAFEVILTITPDQDNATPVSVFTAGGRALWAQAYQELIKVPANAETLQRFHEGILVVCLDSKGWGTGDGVSISSSQFGGTEELENRWYDKHQLIIDAEGQVAFNLEASRGDRAHWARWIEDLLNIIVSSAGSHENGSGIATASHDASSSSSTTASSSSSTNIDAAQVTGLFRALSVTYGKSFAAHVRAARHEVTTLSANVDAQPLHLPYGRQKLAALDIDPDAFVQLSLQLAQYHMRDKWTATSELCSTTNFFHGTHEVVRTATAEAQHAIARLREVQRGSSSGGGAVTSSAPSDASSSDNDSNHIGSDANSSATSTSVVSPSAAAPTAPDAAAVVDPSSANFAGAANEGDPFVIGAGIPRGDATISTNTKEELANWIRAASARHSQLVVAAACGQGMDRHLMALQSVAQKSSDKPAMEFFNDELYNSMQRYSLQTSPLARPWLQYYSIGPHNTRGYGVGYVIDEDEVRLSLCAFNSNPLINMSDMRMAVLTAASIIYDMLAATPRKQFV